MCAMVLKPEEGGKDDLNLFTHLQTKTCKDVKINPELTKEQRDG